MSGHHKFSELTKDWSPERKRRIKAEAAKMLARYDAVGGDRAAAVEDLQIRHKGRFGELPKYTRDADD